MNPQIPAEGILIQKDWGHSKLYKVTCECGCDDCSHMVDVEADETGVVVTTYTTQKTNFWSMVRLQLIWTLLTKGYVEYEASLCMTKQQALNYANVLQLAIVDVEKFNQQRKEKSAAAKMAEQGDCI